MTRDWIDITPAELSYLSDAPEDGGLLMAGPFARRPISGPRSQKELGRLLWDERERSVGGVESEAKAAIGLIGHVLNFAAQGSAISASGSEETAVIVSAVVEDVAAQLLVTSRGTGARLIAWPPTADELAEEVVGLLPSITGLRALRLAHDVPPAGFEWSQDMGGSLTDAVHNASAVAVLAPASLEGEGEALC